MAVHGADEIDVALHVLYTLLKFGSFHILWTNLTLGITPVITTDMDLEHPGLKHEFFTLKKLFNIYCCGLKYMQICSRKHV